jgi:quercetin dioxygenase-like cupin family protein
MKAVLSTMCAAAILSGGSQMAVQAQTSNHVIATVQEAQWGPAPPVIPPGAQIAVLAGNPMGAGAYTIRIKMPANYAIPAHSHPTDENVVVVSGALTFGMGDKLATDASSNKTLSPGGFALMPANMNHFAYTTAAETTIVLYGQGPVEFKYVNPADDPRNQNKGTK